VTTALVYGATGFVGRRTCAALTARGVSVVISGRDGVRLGQLASELEGDIEVRQASLHDDEALGRAIADTQVVVNCAGPFSRLGESVLRAAVYAGVHYLDCAAEQAFVRDMFERFESPARHAGICVVNGLGFEGGLGDWLARAAAESLPGGPLDAVSVAYLLEDFRTTAGTQLSMLAGLESTCATWEHDRWEPTNPAAKTLPVRFPEPYGMREALSFPSGEVITVPRHITTHSAQGYLSIAHDSTIGRALTTSASLVGPLVGALLQSPLGAFAKAKLGAARRPPNDAECARARFAIVARAERSFERREVSLSGTDPYGVSAEVLAYGAAELLANGPRDTGILAPSQAFDYERALDHLCERASLERMDVSP